MARKTANTSYDKHQLVIYDHKKGESVKEIMSLFQISRPTVYRIIKQFEEETPIDFKQPPGRQSKLIVYDKHFIMRSVVYDPKIATELCERSGKTISSQIICRILKNTGYNSRMAGSKPIISTVNEKNILCLHQSILMKPKLIGRMSSS